MMENTETPTLVSASFHFYQEANCLSNDDEVETLDIEYTSSLGLDNDGEGFFVLKTKSWSMDNIDDMIKMFDRCKRVLK